MRGTGERGSAWVWRLQADWRASSAATSPSIPPSETVPGLPLPFRTSWLKPEGTEPTPAKTASPTPSPSPLADPSRRKTVLLVEDDEASAQALCILLRRQGWQVDLVGTIAEANLHLDVHTPDSIILDLMLPDGEGSVILDRVRQQGIKAKVTITTASTDPERLNQVREMRPDALLKKPLDLLQLLRTI